MDQGRSTVQFARVKAGDFVGGSDGIWQIGCERNWRQRFARAPTFQLQLSKLGLSAEQPGIPSAGTPEPIVAKLYKEVVQNYTDNVWAIALSSANTVPYLQRNTIRNASDTCQMISYDMAIWQMYHDA